MSPNSSSDAAFTVGVMVAFAALVTVHIATVFGVFKNKGALPGLGAIVIPPLAPYFAARAGLYVRTCLWVVAAAAYAVAFYGARA